MINYDEEDLPPPPPPPALSANSLGGQLEQPLLLDYQDPSNLQYDASTNTHFVLPINLESNSRHSMLHFFNFNSILMLSNYHVCLFSFSYKASKSHMQNINIDDEFKRKVSKFF